MGYWGMTSFLWSFFQWFFQGDPSSANCGFRQFPSLGLAALAQSWSFDFSLTYVGVGKHPWHALPRLASRHTRAWVSGRGTLKLHQSLSRVLESQIWPAYLCTLSH